MPIAADPGAARALLAVARLVHAECERAGVVVDDRPELVLTAVARWCEGTATADELRALRNDLYAPGPGYDASAGRGAGRGAARALRGLASDLAAYVGGGRGIAREKSRQQALDAAWICLKRLGETEAAAKARVRTTYVEALCDRQDEG